MPRSKSNNFNKAELTKSYVAKAIKVLCSENKLQTQSTKTIVVLNSRKYKNFIKRRQLKVYIAETINILRT